MASAFKTKYGWIADFRPIFSPGKTRRRVRIPADRLMVGKSQKEAASAFAQECDRFCRILEIAPNDDDISHALAIKAITPEQATALNGGFAPPPASDNRLSIIEMAESHPSTIREQENNPNEYFRHMADLKQFCEWSGLKNVEDISLVIVQKYIQHLKMNKLSFDGRRHKLMYIRRACKMAASHGIPDVLSGFSLDKQGIRKELSSWTLEELCAGALYFLENDEPRALAALALGGFMGLRSSEIYRAHVGDFQDDILKVGIRERKNTASRRDLPIPKIVNEWIAPLLKDRSPDTPLLMTMHRGLKGPFSCSVFSFWMNPRLEKATGRDLPAKCLRKSFATWAIMHDISPRHVESYLGHQAGYVSLVTARHYLVAAQIKELRPVAVKIDELIRNCLEEFSTQSAKS